MPKNIWTSFARDFFVVVVQGVCQEISGCCADDQFTATENKDAWMSVAVRSCLHYIFFCVSLPLSELSPRAVLKSLQSQDKTGVPSLNIHDWKSNGNQMHNQEQLLKRSGRLVKSYSSFFGTEKNPKINHPQYDHKWVVKTIPNW